MEMVWVLPERRGTKHPRVFKCIACKEFRNSMYQLALEKFGPSGEAVADWYATHNAGSGWTVQQRITRLS